MSRRTEDDDARDLVPKADAHYLEGEPAEEWAPIDDKRAAKVLAMLLLATAGLQ